MLVLCVISTVFVQCKATFFLIFGEDNDICVLYFLLRCVNVCQSITMETMECYDLYAFLKSNTQPKPENLTIDNEQKGYSCERRAYFSK